jgi:hypothetical protein
MLEHRRLTEAATDRPRLGLLIDGNWYANSAAKYWPWLVDRQLAEAPQAALIELTAPATDPLRPSMLYPEQALQRELEKALRGDAVQSWEDTLAELDLVGGPSPVQLRVLGEGARTVFFEGTSDTMDSETFPCLVVWLLQWADIPASLWNKAAVAGRVNAMDPVRHGEYRFRFSLTNRHLSEGLYQRCLRLDVA